MAKCDGCLSSRICWVCLGMGITELKRGVHRPCQSCFGSGKCSYCQPVVLADLGHPPELSP